VQARRDSRAYRLRRFVVRNRVAVSAVSAVMLALVMGLAATLWQARAARTEAEHANTIKQFVLSVIQEADPQASQRTREADMALLDATRDRIARELASRPDLQLEVRLAIATAYRNRGAWEPARQTLRAAVDEVRGRVSENNLDLLTARVRLAEWPIVDGAKALEELDAVVAASRRLGKPAVPLLIEALLARKSLKAALEFGYVDNDPAAESLAEAREIVALAEGTYPAGHPKAVEAMISLANSLASAGKRKEALDLLEPTWLAARESPQLGPGHPTMLRVHASYGLLLCKTGRCKDGLKMLRDNVDLARTHHGPNSRVLGDALMSLSTGIFYVFRDYKEFIALRREAFKIAAATEPIGSLRRSAIAQALAHPLVGVQRPLDVRPLLEEMKHGRENLPEGTMRTMVTWWLGTFEGWDFMLLGDTGRALDIFNGLLLKAEGPEGNIGRVIQTRFNIAWALRLAGDAAAAEPILEHSLALIRRRLDTEYFDIRYDIGELGTAKLALGKLHEALALLDESMSNRMEVTGRREAFFPGDAMLDVARGEALLRLRRDSEARDQFRRVVEFWRDFDPEHPMAAEAAWWYGHSLIATGEVARGKAMVAEARPRLAASFLPHLRPLATAPAPIPLPANRAPKAKAQVATH
jgi:tetratricopeptide (TPR) repeat protein